MKVLITGIAGFIGSHTVEVWKGKLDKIYGIDNFSSGSAENLQGSQKRIMEIFQEDICDRISLLKTLNQVKPDVVLHLAAQPSLLESIRKPSFDALVNAYGTAMVAETARYCGVKHFVFSSTSAISESDDLYPTMPIEFDDIPTSPYGISKLAAEMYVRSIFPKNHTILRYANVYGPRQVPLGPNQLIPRAIRHVLFGDDFEIYGIGMQTRDFIYVRDVARANYLACIKRIPGTYNISSGTQVSVIEVLNIIKETAQWEGKWKFGLPRDDRQRTSMTNEKFVAYYKWKPRMVLAQGILHTIDHWKKQEK